MTLDGINIKKSPMAAGLASMFEDIVVTTQKFSLTHVSSLYLSASRWSAYVNF